MAFPSELLEDLQRLFGERLSTVTAIREQHGRGESFHPVAAPDAVIFPETTQEVAEAVRACARHGVPIVPFGAGTCLEGNVAALRGGLSIDLSKMTRIVAVATEDMTVTVEAGVTRQQLNSHLRDTGLFFPVDPGAEATFGGMAATRASGTTTVRYGSMRENVVSMKVVLADGRVIDTASRAPKSAAGYDLTRLFIGSEGTLGIITELTLRLYGIPEAVMSAVGAFPGFGPAIDMVTATLQMGLPVARIEFLDEAVMGAIVKNAHLDYRVAPTLFFELHGAPGMVAAQAEELKALAGDFGATDFRWTTSPEEGNALWAARHKAYYAIGSMRPGKQILTLDSCVPRSRLAECILAAQGDLAASPLTGGILGHVGDGNFHVGLLVDAADAAEMAEAERLSGLITRRALAAGGTCTGEHGIGYGKIGYLQEELGEAVAVMRLVKGALDPQGLMNPGKLFAL